MQGRSAEHDAPTKECPYCHGLIASAAVLCSHCWKDLKTGRHVQMGQDGRPLPPSLPPPSSQLQQASESEGKNSSGKVGIKPPAQRRSDPAKSKSCVNCGGRIPLERVMCPVCGTLQDKAADGSGAGTRSASRHAFGPIIAGTIVAICVGVLGLAVYCKRDAILGSLRRQVAASTAEPATAVGQEDTNAASPEAIVEANQPDDSSQDQPDAASDSAAAADGETVPPAAAPSGRPAGVPETRVKAVCPCCNGEGYYMRNEKERERCPLCRTEGFRMLQIPGGNHLCPDCKGIGQVEETPNLDASRVRRGLLKKGRRCQRCQGLGYVKGD